MIDCVILIRLIFISRLAFVMLLIYTQALKLLSYHRVQFLKRQYIARTTILVQLASKFVFNDWKFLFTRPQTLITLPATQCINFIYSFII